MLERMLAALAARAPRTLLRQLRPKRAARATGGAAPRWEAAEEQALAQAASFGEAERRSQYSERLVEISRQLSDQGFTVGGAAWSPPSVRSHRAGWHTARRDDEENPTPDN